jgi:hypothetical protein
MSRLKIVGWCCIVVASAFLLYFLRTRLLTAGLPLERKEWMQVAMFVAILILGTINVRLAAMRESRRAGLTHKQAANDA